MLIFFASIFFFIYVCFFFFFFFSSRRRHTRCLSDWSSDVCSSDLGEKQAKRLTHDFPQSQPFQLSKIGHAPSGSPQFRYDALLKIVTVVDAASEDRKSVV